MSWISGWLRWGKRPDEIANRYWSEGDYALALDVLGDAEDHEELRQKIIRHWLCQPVQEAKAGHDDVAAAQLGEIEKVLGDKIPSEISVVRLQLRETELARDLDEGWAKLLKAAGVQSRRFYGPRSTRPAPRHALFADKSLAIAARRLAPDHMYAKADSAQVESLDPDALERLVDTVAFGYPEPLWSLVPEQIPSFVRGALFVAVCRPDLALFPLLEAPGTHPLISFELARVAHALGYPKMAKRALEAFAEAAGGHQTVKGVHTAIFLAQLHAAAKDHEAACALLASVDFELSTSSKLLYARSLVSCDRLDEAETLLSDTPEGPRRAEIEDEIRRRRTPS